MFLYLRYKKIITLITTSNNSKYNDNIALDKWQLYGKKKDDI